MLYDGCGLYWNPYMVGDMFRERYGEHAGWAQAVRKVIKRTYARLFVTCHILIECMKTADDCGKPVIIPPPLPCE